MSFAQVLSAVLAIALLAGTGCNTVPGRNLAEQLSSTTAAYEQKVTAKIAAENTFYDRQLLAIRQQIAGEIEFSEFAELTDPVKAERVKKTLLYERIRFGAERQARLSAARLLDNNASAATEIIDVLDKGIAADLQYARDLRTRQLGLRVDRITGLAKLEHAKDDLAAVRRQLTTIATEDGAEAQAKALAAFGQALRAELNSDQKQSIKDPN